MDSRNFMKESNKIFSFFLLQTSKRSVHLFGTAQYFNTVEKRFRDNTKFQCYCERVYKLNGEFIEVNNINRMLQKNENLYIKQTYLIKKAGSLTANFEMKQTFLKASPIFQLYDTKQLLAIE
jgi:hypothetical protein